MDKSEIQKRMQDAIRLTAPGQPIRAALDMIIAGHLGALICVGDTERVLAAGNDGFPLNISFTSNRLFELSKMDGAIVIDGDITQILRANFHLNPDPSLATSETGMRHRTAARMSVLTDAIVISVSARRAVVNVYVHGKSFEIQPVPTIMASVNQLVATLQTTRASLDRSLLRLTALELDDYVTLADVTDIFSSFEIMQQAKEELEARIAELGNQGKLVRMQLEQLAGSNMDEEYNLMIRDYAADSSEENAQRIRQNFFEMPAQDLTNPKRVAEVLGYDDLDEDSVLTPLGLRTLSRVSVVRDGVAEKIVDEYGSLQDLMDDIRKDPERLGDFGVNNPAILADSLYRMQGPRGGTPA
ncbi:MAG: DNA integrity scanning diadenylate cyclase DisA [Coriobacteriaceae bacterium]|nr:DNA integrity scanning diadenylate cyclase DisA [Coriobacteriaceae bacterium]